MNDTPPETPKQIEIRTLSGWDLKEIRKHADMPISFPKDYGREVLWDVEIKQKDLAINEIRRLKELAAPTY